MRNNNK